MLKDRRVLLEKEIVKYQEAAAWMFLDIVTHDGDVHSSEYQTLKNTIMNLEFDLKIINQLIRNGHK